MHWPPPVLSSQSPQPLEVNETPGPDRGDIVVVETAESDGDVGRYAEAGERDREGVAS